MSKLLSTQLFPPTGGIKDDATRTWAQQLVFFLDETLKKISAISFNRSEKLSVADTGNADTEFSITHHLQRIPEGFIVTKIDKVGIIYKSTTAWKDTTVYLKCSAANAAVELYLF